MPREVQGVRKAVLCGLKARSVGGGLAQNEADVAVPLEVSVTEVLGVGLQAESLEEFQPR